MTAPILPPDARGDPLHQHLVIIGKTGSGKTYAAKGLVERLLGDGRRVCVIDPTGVWWGLRSSADGQAPGFPVAVFGGDHADIAIAEDSGAVLAELVARENLPCVIDLSEFLIGERTRFMTAFAEHLYRHNRAPLHLVIDEADEFAPQNPLPESRRMSGGIDRLVRRGRVKGFRVMLITQRPAVLHKNVLTQANSMLALRLIAPQDRKAIEEWIKGQADIDQGKAVLASLARLTVGEGWVWSPEHDILERRTFPAIATFDSSATPDDGAAPIEPVSLADVDLSAIEASLHAAAVEEPVPGERIVTIADPEAFARGVTAGRRALIKEIAAAVDKVQGEFETLMCAVAAGSSGPTQSADQAPAPAPARSNGHDDRPSRPQTLADHAGARAILMVLATLYPGRFSWQQAATLAGLKARGGHFNAARKILRGGLIVEADGLIAASVDGLDAAGAVTAQPRTPAETLAMWKAKLPAPAPQMLDYLASMHGAPVDRDQMAAALGKQPRGGHWNNGMSLLRNNGLVEDRDGRLRLASILLPGRAP